MEEKANENNSSHGRIIGNLERILILILLALSQYQAIGFVIAGKSVARFKSDVSADYFIIGTFYSIIVTIISFGLIWGF